MAAPTIGTVLFMEQYPFARWRAYKFHPRYNVSRYSFTKPRLLRRHDFFRIHALRLSASAGERRANCHSDADAYAECNSDGHTNANCYPHGHTNPNPDYYTNADADGVTKSKAKAPPSSVTL